MKDEFSFISPLDFRYCRGIEWKNSRPFLSENAKICYALKVEAAYIKALAEIGVCKKKAVTETMRAIPRITPEMVFEEEKKTRHDVKAIVNCLKKQVSPETKPFIHLGLTSYDVIDTANALRYKEFAEKVLLPELIALEKVLIKIALKHKKTLQIGRTHGQHAVPITFGFAVAGYVERIGSRIKAIETAVSALKGKASGAVGSFNALSLIHTNPEKIERSTLSFLGLKPARHSTQILPREQFTDLMHSITSTLGVLANIADDMRHLQRTEIAEIAEFFEKSQVGSSTMPHKKNPIAFENIKSIWKAFAPRMLTVYFDQISEHQRDLSNSASERFLPETLFACLYSTARMKKAFEKLYADRNAMKKNLNASKEKIAAEPLYVLLSLKGMQEAHEAVKDLALSKEKGVFENSVKKPAMQKYLNLLSSKELDLLKNPEKYTGIAEKKTVKVCNYWKKELGLK